MAAAFFAAAALSALPGDWEVYGAPHPEVTPRGTAPLPPPPGATLTPTRAATQTPVVTPGSNATPESSALPTQQPSPEPQVRAGEPLSRPISTEAQTRVSLEQGGSVGSMDAPVTVAVPPQATTQEAVWRYQLVALTAAQQGAADRQGLIRTNIALTVSLEPPQPIREPFTLTVRYGANQIAGIEPRSLALYFFEEPEQRWQTLESCYTSQTEQMVECKGRATGTFLLAGTSPNGVPALIWGIAGVGAAAILLTGAAVWLRRTR